MASGSSGGNTGDGVDFKYPTWDGTWDKWQEYQLRVELRANGMKEEERALLGPRLAPNLTGRAFDSIAECDREKLRKQEGWRYLLQHLEKSRGKEKVDLLGDVFTDFFVRKDVYRKEGEELVDYEPRFRQLIRRLEKALRESGAEGKIPSEVFGWYLLNCCMRMDPSDVANVRGRAESYKLEHVLHALQRMWSGGGLAAKDQDMKSRKEMTSGQAMMIEEVTHEDQNMFHAFEENVDSGT